MSTPTPILEHVAFRLMPDADPVDIEATDAAADRFLAAQPGFIRRELVRTSDGGRIDLVWWIDRGSALAADAAFADHPVSTAYAKVVDPQSVRPEHLEIIRTVTAG